MRRGFRFRAVYQGLSFSCLILAVFASSFVFADPNSSGQKSAAEIVSKAVQEHQILYKLTTLDEFKQIVGQPVKETTKTDGDMEICDVEYSDVRAWFGKMKDKPVPFTILRIAGEDRAFDIGENRQIVLRDADDLNKIDSFWGFANVSLANLDLREHKGLLEEMPFDSRTKWPEPNKLPEGFQPARLLEEGKNPGLGVRRLHEQKIDGRGVGIAVIDQPLLKEHIEYADRLVRYEPIDVHGVPVQMHGPPVASIAVGKTCGVAPGAALSYFAVPMWKQDNSPYCEVIDRIIKLNESSGISERIRVVSISTGMFPNQANFDRWEQALEKAKQHGILVVTCSQDWLSYGMLARVAGKDADDPNNYRSGRYGVRPGALLVPTGNRTTASHEGVEVYTYWTQAGMSWAAPYLAGLAALAYQVDPEIKPDEIVKLWLETAVKTDVGSVVNPPGFIEAVRKNRQQNKGM
jgi:serine protease AprX